MSENSGGRWEARAREAQSENFSQLCFADCASVSVHLIKVVKSLCVTLGCFFLCAFLSTLVKVKGK